MIETPGSGAAVLDTVVQAIRSSVATMDGIALPVDEITERTTFWLTDDPGVPSLSFDSLDFLNLTVILEEEHGWTVPEAQISVETLTVGDLARLVLDHGDAS